MVSQETTKVSTYAQAQDLAKILAASKQAKLVLEEIISQIQPGKTEKDLYQVTREIYQSHAITRSWHNPYIRFGTNTVLTYADKAEANLTLQEEDIAFIDIGPIFNDIEGDVGKTIVFGDNQKFLNLKTASEELFRRGLEFFRAKNPSGLEMQDFIVKEARAMGYDYLLKSGGHLIGSFSHGASWNQGIATYNEAMQPGIWILEIQIKDPNEPYGAFYEDLLI